MFAVFAMFFLFLLYTFTKMYDNIIISKEKVVKKMRKEVIEAIEKEKIIVIVRGVKKEKLMSLCNAMYEGGIRLLEVTYDASGAVSDEETSESIKMLSKEFEGRMYIGAGTAVR